MKLHKFSSPLSKFASHFHEIWRFEQHEHQTFFERNFELYPRNIAGSVLLRLIAHFFKKGVEKHTKIIAEARKPE